LNSTPMRRPSLGIGGSRSAPAWEDAILFLDTEYLLRGSDLPPANVADGSLADVSDQ